MLPHGLFPQFSRFYAVSGCTSENPWRHGSHLWDQHRLGDQSIGATGAPYIEPLSFNESRLDIVSKAMAGTIPNFTIFMAGIH